MEGAALDPSTLVQTATRLLVTVGLEVVGAIIVFSVGRRLMAWSGRLGNFAAGATLAGPLFSVRPCCHDGHCWQASFDTLRAVGQALAQAGSPAPQQHLAVHPRA